MTSLNMSSTTLTMAMLYARVINGGRLHLTEMTMLVVADCLLLERILTGIDVHVGT